MATVTAENERGAAQDASQGDHREAKTIRKVNVPLLIGTVVVGAIVSASLWFWREYQVARTAHIFLARAAELEQKEQWREAGLYIHRYLQLSPTDEEARVRLAEVYDKSIESPQQRNRAVALYYEALGVAPEEKRSELRIRLAALLLDLRRYVEVVRETETLAESGNLEAMRLAALAKYGQFQIGSLKGAEVGDALHAALYRPGDNDQPATYTIHKDEGDVQLASILARVWREHQEALAPQLKKNAEGIPFTASQRLEQGNRIIDDMLRANPQSVTAHLAAFGYRAEYQLAGADEALQQAVKLGPDKAEVRLAAGSHAVRAAIEKQQLGDADQAKARWTTAAAHYQHLLDKIDAKNEAAYLGLGECQLALDQAEEAIETFRLGLKKANPDSVTIHVRLAAALMAEQSHEDAGETLSALDRLIVKFGPDWRQEYRSAVKNAADYLRANWLGMKGDRHESAARLERLAASWSRTRSDFIEENQVWLSLGKAKAAIGRWDQAAEAFEESGNRSSGDPQAVVLAAAAWEQAGLAQRAVECYQRALNLTPSQGLWTSLARVAFQYQASQLPAQRDWTLFERAISEAERLAEPSEPQQLRPALLLRADYWNLQAEEAADEAARDKARETALGFLRRAEEQEPDSEDLTQTLIVAYERLGQSADADRALAKYEAASADAVKGAAARARLQHLRKDFEGARATISAAIRGASPDQQRAFTLLAVQTYLAEENREKAREALTELHEDFPSDPTIVRYLAELDLERGNAEALASWSEKLKELEGDEVYTDFFDARMYLARSKSTSDKDFAHAARLQEQIVKARPHWSAPWLLKGMIEERRRNVPLAIEAYQNAIARGDRSVSTYQRLFQLLVAANRTAEAEQHLMRLKQRGWLTSNLENLEITIAAREGDWERALAAARRAAQNRPHDPLNHLWLGQLLLASQKTEEAEAAFRQAVAANEKDVRGWNGLFSYYLRAGKNDLARETLAELAAKAELTESQRVFVLAQGYEHLGDVENAELNYQRAAELEPKSAMVQLRLANFYVKHDPAKAQVALEKVLELAPTHKEARFALAATLAGRGDDSSWQKALELLEEPGSEKAACVNQRFEVVLLLSRGGRRNLEEARQIAERLASVPAKPAPIDQLLLIRVCERQSALEESAQARGRILREAEDQYLSLIAENPKDPTYAAGLIDLLRRNNQGAKAAGWVRQLESAWISGNEADWDKLAGYVDFLISRGFNKEAVKPLTRLEQLLAAEVKIEPGRAAQLIDLCIRSDETSRAASWLNKLDELEPNTLRALTARVRWLDKTAQSGQVAPLIDAFARSVVAKAMDNQQKAILVLQLGNLCMHSELHAEAERWYREYIRFQPQAYYTVALAVAKQGRVVEAIRFCEQPFRTDSSTRPAIALAMVLVNSQPDEKATRLADPLLRAAVEKHSDNAELLRTVADVRLMQGRVEEAKNLYEKALQLEPRSVILLNNLAALYSEQEGKLQEANNYIDQALSIAGPQAALYDTKGMIRLYSGDAKLAAEYFETAAYLADSDPRHHFHLAAAYEALGEIDKARNAFQKSLDSDLSGQFLTETDHHLLARLSAELK